MLSKRFLCALLCVFFSPILASECDVENEPFPLQRTELFEEETASERIKLFLDSELLYWKPDQMGMTYCLLEETDTFTFILAPQNQERQQQSNWGLGSRVRVGVDIETIHSDISAFWTRFHHTMHSITQTDGFIFGSQVFFGGEFPLGGGALAGIVGTPGGAARSEWNLHLDLAEMDFGYQICLSKWFSLHPYLGLAAAWIHQKQKIHYDQFLDTNNNIFFDAEIVQKNDFNGIGPTLGLDGTFHMGYGLGLFGKLATCFFYGSSHNPVSLQVDNASVLPSLPSASVSYKQYRLMPGLSSQIGLNWEKRLTKYFGLLLGAAYEVQYFWETWRNQSSFIQCIAISDTGYGDLMFHGFTGQIRLSF